MLIIFSVYEFNGKTKKGVSLLLVVSIEIRQYLSSQHEITVNFGKYESKIKYHEELALKR